MNSPLASNHPLPSKRRYTHIFLSTKDDFPETKKFVTFSLKSKFSTQKSFFFFPSKETWRRRWEVCEEMQWGQMLRQQSTHKMFFSFFLTSSCSKQALKNFSFNKTSSHAGNSPVSICKIESKSRPMFQFRVFWAKKVKFSRPITKKWAKKGS